MMKRGKRCLPSRGPKLLTRAASVLLSFCLLFSLCPVSPFARAEDAADPAAAHEFPGAFGSGVTLTSADLYLDNGKAFNVNNPAENGHVKLTPGLDPSKNPIVSKNDTFVYFAVFEILDMNVLKSAADDTYSLALPSGLVWPETQAPVKISIDIMDEDGTSDTVEFATFEVKNGVAEIQFKWSDALVDSVNGVLKLAVGGCKFDIPLDSDAPTYTVKLTDDIIFTLTISENNGSPYKLEWVKSECKFNISDNLFSWKLKYTPGRPGLIPGSGTTVEVPTYIEIPLDFENGDEQSRPFGLWQFLKDGTDDGTTGTMAVQDSDGKTITLDTNQFSVVTFTDTKNQEHKVLRLELSNSTADYDLSGKTFFVVFKTARTDESFLSAENGAINEGALTVYNDAYFEYSESLLNPTPTDPSHRASRVTASASTSAIDLIAKGSTVVGGGKSVTWTITVNLYDRRFQNLVLHDTYNSTILGAPTGVTVKDAAGNVVSPAPTFVSASDCTYEMSLPTASPKYTIQYTTAIDQSNFDEGKNIIDAENDVKLTFDWLPYGGGDTHIPFTPPTADKTATIDRTLIKATGTAYSTKDHTITWNWTANPYNVNVSGGTITATLPAGLTFDSMVSGQGSFSAVPQQGDKTLTFTLKNIGTASAPFSFKTVLDDSEALYYAYNAAKDSAHNNNIKSYTTKLALMATVIPIAGGDAGSISVTAQQDCETTSGVIKKESLGYDYKTHLITWKITLNQNGMPMDSATLTDVLPEGLVFVSDPNDLPGGLTLTNCTTSAVTYDSATRALEIDLTAVGQNATVTFQTLVDPDAIPAFKTDTTVTVANSITLSRPGFPITGNLVPTADGKQTVLDHYSALYTGSATQQIKNTVLSKSGSLSGDKTCIDYTVNINVNAMDLTDLALTDEFAKGTRPDLSTVKLYPAAVSSGGAVSVKDGDSTRPVAGVAFTYDPETNKLVLPLGAPMAATNCRVFVLKYSVDIIDSTQPKYTNTVYLTGRNTPESKPEFKPDSSFASGSASAMRALKGGIRLILTDRVSGNPVSGITFYLYDASGKTKLDSATTDANGKLEFVALKKTDYLLIPGVIPEGYQPTVLRPGENSAFDSHPTVTKPLKDGYTEVVAELDRVTTSMTFTKVSALGPALAGVNFTLTSTEKKKSGAPIFTASATTGADGSLTFEGIYYVFTNKYTLTETTAPAGHTAVTLTGKPVVASDGTVSFQFDASSALSIAGGKVTITDPLVVSNKGTILVYKYNELTDAPISGIEFRLYDGDKQLQSKTTGGDGVAIFSGLDLDKTYTVKESVHPDYRPTADRTVTLNESHASERLSWANKPLPKEGALTIYKYDATTENHVPMSEVAFTLRLNGQTVQTKTTDVNGKVVFSGLKLDVTYTVTETAPSGYLPTASRDFTLTNTNEGDNYLLLDWPNVRCGDLTIHKYDATEGGSAAMSGVTFSLFDGNELAASAVTDANGNAVFQNLKLDTPYTITETVPDGYQPVPDKLITLTNTSYSQTVQWPNVRCGEIIIHKYDATGGGHAAMSGVTFSLFDGSEPVASVVTDADGNAAFRNLKLNTPYTLTETVPDGYQPVPDKLITLTSTSYSQTVQWPNLRKGEIVIHKYDSALMSPMSGVTFALYLDGTQIAVQTTDANGYTTFTGLTPGKEYVLRETVPIGYLPTSDRHVTLTNEQYSQVIEWPNYRSGGGGGDSGGTKPSPSPTPSPSPSPSASPSPSPSVSPSVSPSPSPSPVVPESPAPSPGTTNPPATPSAAPTTPPYIRPDLDPGKIEDVLDLVDRAQRDPDIVIRDRETLQEEYPELDIDDLPTPLYWGPDIAVIETPSEELVVIDSDLIPLGALPQTGSTNDASAVLLPAGLAAAAGLCLLLTGRLRKRRED